MRTIDLRTVLDRVDTWQGRSGHAAQHYLPTASDELNQAVGGLPVGALSEILLDRIGIGELSLLMPAFAEAMADDRWLVFIAAPQVVYGPELERGGLPLRRVMALSPTEQADQHTWAAEQCLRSGACGAVLLWADQLDARVPRRLQLAAEQGAASGLLFRSGRWADQSSAAALRLRLEHLEASKSGLRIKVIKQRGGMRYPEVSWS